MDMHPTNGEENSTDLLNGTTFWRQIVDNAPAMLWCIDKSGVPIYYNQRWLEFSGLSAKSDLRNAWASKLHPDDRDWVFKTSGESLKQRQPIHIEYRLQRFDGKYRTVLDKGEPQFDSAGEFTGYIGSTIDITEQSESARRLLRSNEQLNRSSREITLLNELNDHLQVCQTIEETHPILRRYGRQLFPNASVSICLVSESRNVVEPFASWGDEATLTRMFAPDECWALRRGKIHIEKKCQDGSLCPNTRNCKIKFGYACIPMMAYGEVLGVMNVCYHSADETSDDSSSLSNRLAHITADQVALAIANLKLRETLQHQSTRDPLTQLYNRRYLLDNLEREFCRAKRGSKTIVALMLDIDNFKRFNDTYGHEAGDLILREVGNLLRRSVRSVDLPCRYGGEEFLVVLVDTDEEQSRKRAEEIRQKISELTIEFGKQPLGNITTSIGIASYPRDGQSIETLLSCADQALYAAKASGRNCIVEYHDFAPKSESVVNSDLPQIVFPPAATDVSTANSSN